LLESAGWKRDNS